MNLKHVLVMLLATLMVIGTAGAVVAPYADAELKEDTDCIAELDCSFWAYGNYDTFDDAYFNTAVIGNTWTDDDGRLAVLGAGDYMLIQTQYATDSFCIVFASDSNDGWAKVSVNGNYVWSGDTWADVPLEQDINAQKIRSLHITGLDYDTHTIKIERMSGTDRDGHVTIYKYGYACPETVQEIPEFPTIALPVIAILGLAFFMQRRKEE